MSKKIISQVLIDWGTSSFRLWAINQDGDVLIEKHAPLGMSKLKPSDYEGLLERMFSELGLADSIPVLICGMAGAAQGWQEAKYLDLPTMLDTLSLSAIKVQTQGRDIRILPGLAQRSKLKPDVMRGEETLLLGAIAENYPYKNYCIPGTHAKWVEMANAEVYKFQTFMTGEMFSLWSKNSTLSYFLDSQCKDLHKHAEFENAIIEIAAKPEFLMSALFSIRSRNLLFPNEDVVSAKARLSGLLIGAELAAMKSIINDKVGLIARDELSNHYAYAMRIIGMDFEVIDSHELALSGLKLMASKLWSN